MGLRVLALSLATLLTFSPAVDSQQTNSSSAQAATIIAQSLAAMAGSTNIADITMTGTAERIVGSDDEAGTVTFKAVNGASRLDLSLSGGMRTEIRGSNAGVPVGTWIGTDGLSHVMAYHNLQTDPGWFPLFAVGNINSSLNGVVTYIGVETHNGTNVIHLSGSRQFANDSVVGPTTQHLTAVEIYLDPNTFLPLSYVFSIHPDNNELLDIPAEIRYSNYQNFGGAQIPLNVQKFVNNNLTLDLRFQSVVVNSGLSAASFGLS